MAAQKVVVVTGANRGIGLAICKEILHSHSPVKLYACSRSGQDLGLSSSKSEIHYQPLDITQKSQITSLTDTIKSNTGHVDVLINNAGLNTASAINNPTASDATDIMNINYHGTKSMCLAFLPLMTKPHARVVNVSSTASSLSGYSQALQDQLRSSSLSISDLDAIAADYVSQYGSSPNSSPFTKDYQKTTPYPLSKALVNALTRTLARDHPDVLINSCCPGWVSTDMGQIMGNAPKSPAEGAKVPVRVGFRDVDGVSGKYWANKGVFDTGEGKVVEW